MDGTVRQEQVWQMACDTQFGRQAFDLRSGKMGCLLAFPVERAVTPVIRHHVDHAVFGRNCIIRGIVHKESATKLYPSRNSARCSQVMISETEVNRYWQIESADRCKDIVIGCRIDHVSAVENEVDAAICRKIFA